MIGWSIGRVRKVICGLFGAGQVKSTNGIIVEQVIRQFGAAAAVVDVEGVGFLF